MLLSILNLKRTKESRAQANKLAAKKQLIESEAAKEAAIKKFDDYVIWRLREETRRYSAIEGRSITERAFQRLKLEMSVLRNKDALLLEDIELSKKALIDAEEAYRHAEKTYKQAQLDVQKYEVLCDEEQAERDRLSSLKEESELEEFMPKQSVT